ncbi:MAG: ABC transporter ATP-binding protein [Candidatus Baldrarchaeia archaeon]
MKEDLLVVRNLKTYYFTSAGAVKAVDDVSLTVHEGESVGIAGESGCGKSTFAFSLLKMVPPPGKIVDGEIILDGTDITKLSEDRMRREVRWKKISMIFQGAMNCLTPVYKVGYQIAEPLIYHLNLSKEEALERARKSLRLVGLPEEIAERYPHELSGGMKQRVIIAMALVLNPKIVIADEPTTALDVIIQAQILNLLKELKDKQKLSIILITHDLSIMAELVDRVVIMYAGKFVEIGVSDNIYKDPAHPYTKMLLKAIPRLREKVSQLEFIPGEPPNLINPPSGCRFHPRCPFKKDICKYQVPRLKEINDKHFVACHLY